MKARPPLAGRDRLDRYTGRCEAELIEVTMKVVTDTERTEGR